MRIGFIGSGNVARALAAGLLMHGHDVMLGARERSKLSAWLSEHPTARVGDFAEAAQFGELVILAVPGAAAVETIQQIAPAHLAGKTVIDTCNPIIERPPTNGVLPYFTDLGHSLMEQLQQICPEARFVKAFNSTGSGTMVNPSFEDGRPSMFICGNSAEAKATVSTLLDQLGWQAEDMGMVESARAIEPLCMLWCLPGILKGDWHHAFKLLH